ncbi:hypothetical protein HK104_011377, partial [Borealophlyctis nickersoniae]
MYEKSSYYTGTSPTTPYSSDPRAPSAYSRYQPSALSSSDRRGSSSSNHTPSGRPPSALSEYSRSRYNGKKPVGAWEEDDGHFPTSLVREEDEHYRARTPSGHISSSSHFARSAARSPPNMSEIRSSSRLSTSSKSAYTSEPILDPEARSSSRAEYRVSAMIRDYTHSQRIAALNPDSYTERFSRPRAETPTRSVGRPLTPTVNRALRQDERTGEMLAGTFGSLRTADVGSGMEGQQSGRGGVDSGREYGVVDRRSSIQSAGSQNDRPRARSVADIVSKFEVGADERSPSPYRSSTSFPAPTVLPPNPTGLTRGSGRITPWRDIEADRNRGTRQSPGSTYDLGGRATPSAARIPAPEVMSLPAALKSHSKAVQALLASSSTQPGAAPIPSQPTSPTTVSASNLSSSSPPNLSAPSSAQSTSPKLLPSHKDVTVEIADMRQTVEDLKRRFMGLNVNEAKPSAFSQPSSSKSTDTTPPSPASGRPAAPSLPAPKKLPPPPPPSRDTKPKPIITSPPASRTPSSHIQPTLDRAALEKSASYLLRNLRHLLTLTLDINTMLAQGAEGGCGLTPAGCGLLKGMSEVQVGSLELVVRMMGEFESGLSGVLDGIEQD